MSNKLILPLTAAHKRSWLRALRSGRLKRGRAHLGDDDMGYCCLGVLGKVTGIKFCAREAFLTNDDGTPLRIPQHQQRKLAIMNDAKQCIDDNVVPKYSFKDIARWIASNVKAKR